MIKATYFCRQCKEKFTIEIFEEGEAQKKAIPAGPVRCKECGSGDLERRG
jgi:DNA-directed RNA polymerase subunit RPC12/RpoP